MKLFLLSGLQHPLIPILDFGFIGDVKNLQVRCALAKRTTMLLLEFFSQLALQIKSEQLDIFEKQEKSPLIFVRICFYSCCIPFIIRILAIYN